MGIPDLEQRITLLETPLRQGELKYLIRPPQGELLKEHEEKYKDGIYLPDWREKLLVLKGVPFDISNLEFTVTSSFHVQAVKHDKAPKDITILGITALMLTKDDKFVYGVRGGNVGSGRADVVPGGHLSFESYERDPVFDCFYHEMKDELGQKKAEDVSIIGYYWDPVGTKATSFVLIGKLDAHSEELDEMHRKAYAIYQNAKERGKEEIEARKDISRSGLPNPDAWEHSELVFVDNDPDLIQMMIATKELMHQDQAYSLWDAGLAPLIMYRDKFL